MLTKQIVRYVRDENRRKVGILIAGLDDAEEKILIGYSKKNPIDKVWNQKLGLHIATERAKKCWERKWPEKHNFIQAELAEFTKRCCAHFTGKQVPYWAMLLITDTQIELQPEEAAVKNIPWWSNLLGVPAEYLKRDRRRDETTLKQETFSCYEISIILSLIGDIDVPNSVIFNWNQAERSLVASYCGACYFAASDNENVTIPPVPDVLKDFIKK